MDGSTTLTTVEDCDYGERCVSETPPRCQGCGRDAARSERTMRDGALLTDCLGCTCDHWQVESCYTDGMGPFMQRSVLIRWYGGGEGFTTIYWVVTPTGTVLGPTYGGPYSIDTMSVTGSATIAPGGAVDFTISMSGSYTDPLGVTHEVSSMAHLVDTCPG